MVDVIILSNAIDASMKKMTQNCIDSINDNRCNIIVIEQTDTIYKNCKTIHIKEKFNYNKFANKGALITDNEWLLIANNDLIFYKGWLDKLLAADYPIVSPKEPADKRQKDLKTGNHLGYETGRHLSGWCFMIRRDLYEHIGGFDEDMEFWCADNSLIEQLRAVKIPPMLVTDAIVRHFGSKTLNKSKNKEELTKKQVIKFNKKYNKNLFNYGQG
jgi:GT2 family glycosyltransferase